jgi:hypothetical protein
MTCYIQGLFAKSKRSGGFLIMELTVGCLSSGDIIASRVSKAKAINENHEDAANEQK